jgi:hypothetical protein
MKMELVGKATLDEYVLKKLQAWKTTNGIHVYED